MMRQRARVAAAIVVAISTIAVRGSQGAETVLSEGAARSCFQAARFDQPASSGVTTCSAALEAGSLTSEDRAATLVNRGILRARLSDFDGALGDYDAGLKIEPALADAYIDRGAVLISMKRYDDAIVAFSKGIELGTQNPHIAYYDRGVVRERTGDFSGACADYKQALKLEPNIVLPSHLLEICQGHGKPKPS